jgi:hypothetical protein
MTKILNRRLQVEMERDLPSRFSWDGQSVAVTAVLDHWEEAGLWWEGEPVRHIYRVNDAEGRCYEIHQELPEGDWWLYRVYD